MPVYPKRNEIIDLIDSRTRAGLDTTQKDIAQELGMFPSNVSRMMNRLREIGFVSRYRSTDSPPKFCYMLCEGMHRTSSNGWILAAGVSNEFLQTVGNTKETNHTATAEALQYYLQKWANRPWEPKILDSYPSLPLVIANLFEQAILIGKGKSVHTSQLLSIISKITQFKKDLEQVLLTIEKLTNTSELHSPTKIYEFLIPDESFIEPVEELVQRVKALHSDLTSDE